MEFIETLKDRNALLYWFGLINLIAFIILMILSFAKPLEFAGANAWHKPAKFAISTTILSWSLAWYIGYLKSSRDLTISAWIVVIMLAFEVIYIVWQAARGQGSHFNVSTPFYAAMYSLMALAASAITLATGYIGLKFFGTLSVELPLYYLWAIRLGFLLFFIFSFEGFAMGSRMSHTVGAADGGRGIPFFNWSLSYGDLRIAHFIGMHALQVLPILAWYLLQNLKLTILASLLYAVLAVFVLTQALKGNSFTKIGELKTKTQEIGTKSDDP